MRWDNQRYHSLNYFFRNKFGEKIIKIPIDGGLSCPNRDGTLSSGGCIFCSDLGSGDFIKKDPEIKNQFNKYKDSISDKWTGKYIPYFQAFTNTYGDIKYLEKIYYEALSIDNTVGLSIATRPDCLGEEVMKLLDKISKETFLMVELGLQTSNEDTGKLINRHFNNTDYIEAVNKLKSINANITTHLIYGLPYENKNDMLESVNFIKDKTHGIKFHLLYICEDTKIGKMYNNKEFKILEFNEYIDIIIKSLEILPPETVIHRLTGDAPREKLIAPKYSLNKRHILNTINRQLKLRNTYQGKEFIIQ